MATTTPLEARQSRDLWGDRTFRAVALGAGLMVLLLLGLIAWITTKNAWMAFSREGIGFVTGTKWVPSKGKFGALPFIWGTTVSATIALAIAVPMSIGIALFTVELASKRLRRWVTYTIDLLAAIPSVVYGFWALMVLAKPAGNVYKDIAESIGDLPGLRLILGGPASGKSFMTAGLILAIMITPIITSLTRETLATVSQEDKNAALAMGATRWEMLRATVFPRARSGIVAAVMLGLGRAMGETIAVALVIGANHQITSRIFQPGDTMAAVIAHEFGEGQGTPIYRSALIGLGVVLFALTILVNVLARLFANRTAHLRATA